MIEIFSYEPTNGRILFVDLENLQTHATLVLKIFPLLRPLADDETVLERVGSTTHIIPKLETQLIAIQFIHEDIVTYPDPNFHREFASLSKITNTNLEIRIVGILGFGNHLLNLRNLVMLPFIKDFLLKFDTNVVKIWRLFLQSLMHRLQLVTIILIDSIQELSHLTQLEESPILCH